MQGSSHYESLSLSEHYVACLMITLHKKWHAIAGNRHPNHRWSFDKSDNSSTAAASNGISIDSSSQTQGSSHYESLSLSEHYVACLMITLHKKWHAVLAKRL
ncbi:hypothetical protein LSTR_LSTR010106 [Laodelphax striatellus]|uniref:Uncharacterized protein n=1 Tax=Laodelphax striatellus TaxID=195883 RepID=A0A482X2Z7_LAOST|nr:hypothetical protein LSTR_LSTR010106 [Laodelphax striatellus]